MASKRTYAAAFDETEAMRINFADDSEPLEVHILAVRPLSRCAEASPNRLEWDLTNLVIDGQPVGRKTVVAWLNCAYQYIHGCDFEAVAEGEHISSSQDLYDFLTFSDAVDSKKPFISSVLRDNLDSIRVCQKLGEQEVKLNTVVQKDVPRTNC